MHIAEELQRSEAPVDLLVHSFTLTGLAMLVSERCRIPMAGFILQPSLIPSSDKEWRCVESLDGGESALIRRLKMRDSFTTHNMLARLKAFAESNPFSAYNLPRLRRDFGLQPAETWPTLHALDVPMIIPMMPGAEIAPRPRRDRGRSPVSRRHVRAPVGLARPHDAH